MDGSTKARAKSLVSSPSPKSLCFLSARCSRRCYVVNVRAELKLVGEALAEAPQSFTTGAFEGIFDALMNVCQVQSALATIAVDLMALS